MNEPGWYDDPDGSGLRWWDGERWTGEVRDTVPAEVTTALDEPPDPLVPDEPLLDLTGPAGHSTPAPAPDATPEPLDPPADVVAVGTGPPRSFYLVAAGALAVALLGSLVVWLVMDQAMTVPEWSAEVCGNLNNDDMHDAFDDLADTGIGVEAVTTGQIDPAADADLAEVKEDVSEGLAYAGVIVNGQRTAWTYSGRLQPEAARTGFVDVDEGFKDQLDEIADANREIRSAGTGEAGIADINEALDGVEIFAFDPTAAGDWDADEQAMFDEISEVMDSNADCDAYRDSIAELTAGA